MPRRISATSNKRLSSCIQLHKNLVPFSWTTCSTNLAANCCASSPLPRYWPASWWLAALHPLLFRLQRPNPQKHPQSTHLLLLLRAPTPPLLLCRSSLLPGSDPQHLLLAAVPFSGLLGLPLLLVYDANSQEELNPCATRLTTNLDDGLEIKVLQGCPKTQWGYVCLLGGTGRLMGRGLYVFLESCPLFFASTGWAGTLGALRSRSSSLCVG